MTNGTKNHVSDETLEAMNAPEGWSWEYPGFWMYVYQGDYSLTYALGNVNGPIGCDVSNADDDIIDTVGFDTVEEAWGFMVGVATAHGSSK